VLCDYTVRECELDLFAQDRAMAVFCDHSNEPLGMVFMTV
jgi:hypothetical protein